MPSLLDLTSTFYNPHQTPPALDLGNIAISRDNAIGDQALREGVLGENLAWDLGEIGRDRAARGGFRSGWTAKTMGRSIQLANQEVGQGRYELHKTLQDLARNRFLISLGMPLGQQF